MIVIAVGRHCERSEAIHHAACGTMDCFVALLLAMTGLLPLRLPLLRAVLFLRHPGARLACFRQSDRDRLLAALDLSAGTAALQRPFLALLHRAFDAARCFLRIFSRHVHFLRLRETNPCNTGRFRSCNSRHDPEKCQAVFPRDKRFAFARRSCQKKLKRGAAL